MDRVLPEILTRHATQKPDTRAYGFIGDGETLTDTLSYAALAAHVEARASALRGRVKMADRVILALAPGLGFVEAFLTCLRAGVIAVPVFPPNPTQLDKSLLRIRAIVKDAEPALCIADDFTRMFLDEPGMPPIVTLEALAGGPSVPMPTPDMVALLQYTSGSTAEPKGVIVTHGNLVHNSSYIHAVQKNDATSISFSWLPSYHDMGLIEGILQPLYGGHPGYLMSPLSFLERPLRWVEQMSRLRATSSGGPNFAYELCARRATPELVASLDLRAWRLAYNGAEPIRASTLDKFRDVFAPAGFAETALLPVYGMAEATLMVSANIRPKKMFRRRVDPTALRLGVIADGDHELVAAGPVHHGMRVKIADPDTHEDLPPNRVGEIVLSGPSITRGYWRKETFGEWFHTGDLGFIDGGELFVTGRKKDLVIIRGENHYPQDIERSVEAAHSLVRPGCVIAVAVDGNEGETLGVVCELKPHDASEERNIRDAIVARVASEHGLQIDALRFLDPGQLPKTSSGKLQRHKARELVHVERVQKAPAISPFARSLRAALLDRIAQLSGRPADPTKSLYAHGVDSLRVLELKAELEEAFGRPIDMHRLATAPSIDAGLALIEAPAPAPVEIASNAVSDTELGVWLWQRANPSSDALFFVLRIASALNQDRVRNAMLTLAQRHAILRTRFRQDGGALRRHIDTEAILPEVGPEALTQPFDFATSPPWRVAFEQGAFTVCAHNIGFDLVALCLFLDELDALLQGKTLPPVPPALAHLGRDRDDPAAAKLFARKMAPLDMFSDDQEGTGEASLTLPVAARLDAAARASASGTTLNGAIFVALGTALHALGQKGPLVVAVAAAARDRTLERQLARCARFLPAVLDPETPSHEPFAAALQRESVPMLRVLRGPPQIVIIARQTLRQMDARWNDVVGHGDAEINMGGERARATLTEPRDLQAPLALSVTIDAGGALVLRLHHQRRVLGDAAARVLMQHLGAALTGTVQPRPHAPEHRPPPATKNLATRILPDGDNVLTFLEPDGKALSGEVRGLLDTFCAGFAALGLRAGHTLALYGEPSARAFVAAFAAARLGVVLWPLDVEAPRAVLHRELARKRPNAIYRDTQISTSLPLDTDFPLWQPQDLVDAAVGKPVPPPVTADAFLDFGDVVLSHAACAAAAETLAQAVDSADEIVASAALLHHPAAWIDALSALLFHRPLYVAPGADSRCPAWFAQHMAERNVTRVRIPPHRARLIANDIVHPKTRLPTIRTWLISGDTMTEDTAKKIAAFLPVDKVRIGYEVDGALVTMGDFDPARPAYAGSPLMPISNGLPSFGVGALSVNGRLTRDRGAFDEEGRLFLRPARRVRGARVDPAEVAAAAKAAPGVRDAYCALGIDSHGDTRVELWVVTSEDYEERTLLRVLKEQVRETSVPFFAEVVSAIDPARPPLPRHFGSKTPPRAPKGDAEIKVARWFSETLGRIVDDANTDFFAFGGDSVMALQLCAAASRVGVMLDVGDIKALRTVAALARKISGSST